MTSTTISSLKADLIRDEGKSAKPYKDTLGHLTIGVGHNLDASGLCDGAVLAQLDFDIAVAEKSLDWTVPEWRGFPEGIQRALVNLSFNLGARLCTFGTFLVFLKDHNWSSAADDLIATKWASQVHSRANRVAELIRQGV